jgi:hypothetical protein
MANETNKNSNANEGLNCQTTEICPNGQFFSVLGLLRGFQKPCIKVVTTQKIKEKNNHFLKGKRVKLKNVVNTLYKIKTWSPRYLKNFII